MKKTIVFVTAALLCQLAFAQSPDPQPPAPAKGESAVTGKREHHRKHGHEKREMMKALNLTEDQKAKLKAMNEGNKEKKQAILNDSKLTEEQKKEQIKEIKKAQATNTQSVLSDEQKAKMKDLRKKMKEGRKNRKHNKQEAGEPAPSVAPQQ